MIRLPKFRPAKPVRAKVPRSKSRAEPLVIPFDLGGEIIMLRIKHNPRARRMILRVDHVSHDVVVTCPTKRSMAEALPFAMGEREWIAGKVAALPGRKPFRHGAVIPYRGTPTTLCHCPEKRRGVWHDPETGTINVSGDKDFMGRRTEDFLKRQAKEELTAAVRRHTLALGLALPKVTVRDTTSRWGSCSSSGALNFSWRLILAPPEILNYVAAHECAHLVHHNHSRAFWAQVEALDPDYEDHEAWITHSGADLFAYGGKTEANTGSEEPAPTLGAVLSS